MPPKKVLEAPPPVEMPDQPPSFDSDIFMDELLSFAKNRHTTALEDGVARALDVFADYKVDLTHGVKVDFVVECILFASQHGFPPRKTSAFVRWMIQMRQSIEETSNVEEAKRLFKDHLIVHAERSQNPEPEGEKDVAPAKTAQKRDAKKGQPKIEEVQQSPKVDANSFLSIGDMGLVADFVVTGLLQHYRLYCHVSSGDTANVTDCQNANVFLQTPMRPPALQRAIPAETYEADLAARRRASEEELLRLKEEEEDRQRAADLENERKEREELRAREEHEANTLYFEKQGTDKAVHIVHEELQGSLAQRQTKLLARLAKLEEALHL